MMKIRIFIFLGILFGRIFSQNDNRMDSIVKGMRWHGSSMTVVVICCIIVAAIVALFYFYTIHMRAKQKKMEKEYDAVVFRETASHLGLNDTERERLWKMVKRDATVKPELLFQSIVMFESILEREITQLIAEKGLQQARDFDGPVLYAIRKKLNFHRILPEHPLVTTRTISVGQSGALYGRDLKTPLIKNARIVDSNEFTFTLGYALDKEKTIVIHAGDELRFVFTRQYDGFYGVPLKVIAAARSGTVEVLHTSNLRRDQLRAHVRIEVSLPIKIKVTNCRGERQPHRNQSYDCRIIDLSGGGLSFVSTLQLDQGDVVVVQFELPSIKISGVTGTIVRIRKNKDDIENIKHHLKFESIDRRFQDSIVKFVFEKQRRISQVQ